MKHRKKKKASLGVLAAAVVVVCAGMMLVALAAGGVFRIRSIIVVGNRNYPKEKIVELSGVSIGDNYFQLSEKKLAERLESDRYIDYVSRDFNYRGTLTIYINERRAMAVIQHTGCNYVIDAAGMILQSTSEAYPVDVEGPCVEGLTYMKRPHFTVGQFLPVEDEEQLEAMRIVLQALDKTNLLSRSSRLNMKKISDISVFISNTTSIELGDTENVELKLMIAAGVLAKRELLEEPKLIGARIDVSDGEKAHFIPANRETPTPMPVTTPAPEPTPTP